MSNSIEDGGMAFPLSHQMRWDGGGGRHVQVSGSNGLSKREWFAGLAMQGLCGSVNADVSAQKVAGWAVDQADCLLAALRKGDAK